MSLAGYRQSLQMRSPPVAMAGDCLGFPLGLVSGTVAAVGCSRLPSENDDTSYPFLGEVRKFAVQSDNPCNDIRNLIGRKIVRDPDGIEKSSVCECVCQSSI